MYSICGVYKPCQHPSTSSHLAARLQHTYGGDSPATASPRTSWVGAPPPTVPSNSIRPSIAGCTTRSRAFRTGCLLKCIGCQTAGAPRHREYSRRPLFSPTSQNLHPTSPTTHLYFLPSITTALVTPQGASQASETARVASVTRIAIGKFGFLPEASASNPPEEAPESPQRRSRSSIRNFQFISIKLISTLVFSNTA